MRSRRKVGAVVNLIGASAVLLAAVVVLADYTVRYTALPWPLILRIVG